MAKALLLIIIVVLLAAAAVAALLKWRRSRQHVGIARQADIKGFNDSADSDVSPALVGRKQVVAPGSEKAGDSGIPLQGVEDALARRPGAPEPGQTFAPGPADQPHPDDQNPPDQPPPQA